MLKSTYLYVDVTTRMFFKPLIVTSVVSTQLFIGDFGVCFMFDVTVTLATLALDMALN